MLSTTANFILVVILGLGILLFALKWGTIGGGGTGATRDENPFNFWLGAGITAAGVIIAIGLLIGSLVSPNRIRLG
jgi:hypothetical protein